MSFQGSESMCVQTPIARPKITEIKPQAMADRMLLAKEFRGNFTTQNLGNKNRIFPARKIRRPKITEIKAQAMADGTLRAT
jgi:hypothetical protein